MDVKAFFKKYWWAIALAILVLGVLVGMGTGDFLPNRPDK